MPLWWWLYLESLIGRGPTRISRVRCDQAKRGYASRVPLPPGAAARRTRGVLVVRATRFLALVRHRRGGDGARQNSPSPPRFWGSLPPTVFPGGKAVESAKKPKAKNSRPQMALRPRPVSLGDAQNPISPIWSTGRLPLLLIASDSGLMLGRPVRQHPGASSGFLFKKKNIMSELQRADR